MAKKLITSSMDVGNLAQHYAARPYDHYRKEVYQLFVDILGCLGSESRILDIGAGPGHLAREYFRRFRRGQSRFVLLDVSRELLAIAEQRLRSRGDRVRTVLRSYNKDHWDRGLGKFDAVVSNNSLFHVWPERLEGFYATCFGRLKKNGILLNQQAFAYEAGRSPYTDDPFAVFMRSLPENILPPLPHLSAADKRRLRREQDEAQRKHRQALEQAKRSGVALPEERGYQFLTVERHLECMRAAGFAAGCIWRKREFAVLLGVKGRPGVMS